ncbi:MAG: D-alanine--D-alanine ligase [Proteobacteria bacterium]|nr:D-alanine--D-alanine ligase [Pseudomonadota bacterium]
MRWKRVGVLLGGISAERDISLKSGRAVAAGLRRSGFEVVEIDAKRDLDRRLEDASVEAVYIALHGRWGEDGTVQGMLEIMGIPYTGSSVLASAVAMDKVLARTVLTAAGVLVPEGFTLTEKDPASLPDGWALPVVVKPVDEGSSVGVSIVRSENDFSTALKTAFSSSNRTLVEQFVDGTEVTVAVLDGKVLGSLEIEPHCEFYNYSAKYDKGGSTHHVPPRLAPARIEEVLELGERAYSALMCSGAARIDLIVPEESRAVVLEVNTIPGMTEVSLLPEIAQHAGLSFDKLVFQIMERATLHIGQTVKGSTTEV